MAEKEGRKGPDRYGDYYWCVKTKLSEDGEIFVHADSMEVNDNGDLFFMQENGTCNLVLKKDQWTVGFAASVLDGHPVAVEHWKGEVVERQ